MYPQASLLAKAAHATKANKSRRLITWNMTTKRWFFIKTVAAALLWIAFSSLFRRIGVRF
ncbi:MAG: hypothetical protein ACFUZC_04800 [Chthoniobacteraceae bacterium]